MPKRIKRQRTRGWTMPPNTISVTRPGKWGNPWKVGEIYDGVKLTAAGAVRLFREKAYANVRLLEVVREELRGHDLACWCKEDAEWCHADVLLEIANA